MKPMKIYCCRSTILSCSASEKESTQMKWKRIVVTYSKVIALCVLMGERHVQTQKTVELNWGHQFIWNCCTHAKHYSSSLNSIESNDKRTQINFAYNTSVFLNDLYSYKRSHSKRFVHFTHSHTYNDQYIHTHSLTHFSSTSESTFEFTTNVLCSSDNEKVNLK